MIGKDLGLTGAERTVNIRAKAEAPVDTRWFQNRLADIRLSQRKLASLLNLDPAAVSLMLRGRRKATSQEVAEIANLLGVGADEVLMRLGATLAAPEKPRASAGAGADDVPLVVVRGKGAGFGGYGMQATPMRAKDVQADPVSVDQVQAEGTDAGMLLLPVPMSDGSLAKLLLPRAMTKQDADRIAALVSAFAVTG